MTGMGALKADSWGSDTNEPCDLTSSVQWTSVSPPVTWEEKCLPRKTVLGSGKPMNGNAKRLLRFKTELSSLGQSLQLEARRPALPTDILFGEKKTLSSF